MIYTGLTAIGLILIWHPVSASTMPASTSQVSQSQSQPQSQTTETQGQQSGQTRQVLQSSTESTNTNTNTSANTNTGNATEIGTDNFGAIDMLNQSFTAVHAKQTGYILHDYSTINHQFTEVKNLSNLGVDLVQELGVQNAKVTKISRADDVFYNVDGSWPNSTEVQVILSSFRDGVSGSQVGLSSGSTAGLSGSASNSPTGITTLAVSVIGKGSNNEYIKQQYQVVDNALKNVGVTPEMDACLEGYLDDKIVGVHAKNVVNTAFEAIGAQPVEGLYTQLETSVSGYTNYYNTNYIQTDGKSMNVQFAVHADDYNHRTNVLVGTPIITTTY